MLSFGQPCIVLLGIIAGNIWRKMSARQAILPFSWASSHLTRPVTDINLITKLILFVILIMISMYQAFISIRCHRLHHHYCYFLWVVLYPPCWTASGTTCPAILCCGCNAWGVGITVKISLLGLCFALCWFDCGGFSFYHFLVRISRLLALVLVGGKSESGLKR